MQLHPVTPFPLTTAPGFESYAADILRLGGEEDVVWTTATGDVVELKAIVKQSCAAPTNTFGTTMKVSLTSILVSAQDVQGIIDGDIVEARGTKFRVAEGGIDPDGFAMVRIRLSEVVT